ncbi:MAG: AtpZ/AtpI family protein [Bryobacteraceae bacterium]
MIPPRPKKDGIVADLSRYISYASLLPVSAFIGFAIGYGLDRWWGTRFLRIVFLLLGIASGFLSLYRELKKDDSSGDK